MENLKKKNIIYLILIIILIISSISIYSYKTFKDLEKNRNYFDIYLSNLYNDLDQLKINNNFDLLAINPDPNISFFANLKNKSLQNINIFEPLEKNLILIKNSVANKDTNQLKVLESGNFFQQTANINYINNYLDKILISDLDNLSQNNFFSEAVRLYLDDI